MASRLEGLIKVHGVQLLASDETQRRAGAGLTWIETTSERVRGVAAPVRAYLPQRK